ncbi:MAG TPA: TIGR03118 family protein [Candidatus Acidoferrales bacterium]|nr:TIGR03118 family protein [Candidatus Acidoferrales bacterium]
MRISVLLCRLLLCAAIAPILNGSTIPGFYQTNLVSDIPGLAQHTDPGMVNPWGVSFTPTSPFWISENGAGNSTLYSAAGVKQSLIVTIPSPTSGMSAPTGQVFNFNNGTGAFNGDLFIFATEDGTIAGWRGALGTTAETLFDGSPQDAVYKGLAIASIGSNTYLYAADFFNGQVTVDRSTGAPALTGNFVDPNLPSGFAPFNVQVFGSQVYVAYAMQDADKHDDHPGPGNGYVSVFDLNGNFVSRLISNGPLNSPWGMTFAPSGFGSLGGDLLVGNFGDGTINVFTPTGAFVGTLGDVHNTPLANDGLWALTFGNTGGSSLFLTAGLNGESDGLFARIDPVPEPATSVAMALGLLALCLLARRAAKVKR